MGSKLTPRDIKRKLESHTIRGNGEPLVNWTRYWIKDNRRSLPLGRPLKSFLTGVAGLIYRTPVDLWNDVFGTRSDRARRARRGCLRRTEEDYCNLVQQLGGINPYFKGPPDDQDKPTIA